MRAVGEIAMAEAERDLEPPAEWHLVPRVRLDSHAVEGAQRDHRSGVGAELIPLPPREGAADPRAVELAEEALQRLGGSKGAWRARVLAGLAVTLPRRRAGRSGADTQAALALARETGDRDAIHAAVVARRWYLCDSPYAREWLAVEEELADLGPPPGPVSGSRWLHSVGRGRAMARLALADRAGFQSDVRAVELWFIKLRNVGLGVQLSLWRATEALLDGRFGDVEQHLATTLRHAPVQAPVWAVQMCRRALELGRAEDFKTEVLRESAKFPENHFLCSLVAFTHTELAEYDQARLIVDKLAADEFTGVTTYLTSPTFAYLAEVVTALGDVPRAARVYELYRPYAGLAAVPGTPGTPCPGAVDRFLGQLAATLGRFDDAERHYEAALVLEAGLRAPPFIARSRYWYGRMLIERGRPEDADRARDLLMLAKLTAEQLGMARLASQTAELL